MKILFSHVLVGRGGDAVQVEEMAQGFRNLGHDVILLGSIPLQPYGYSSPGGWLRNIARRSPWWTKDFVELALQRRLLHMVRRVLAQKRFDLIFHRASIYDFVGACLVKMTTTPVVAHLDAPFAVERAFHGAGYFAWLHKHCMRRLGEVVHLVVTVSKASKDYFVEMGIPAEKIMVVPNGLPYQFLQEGEKLAKAYPPFSDPQRCTIGFVGSLSRWHRVDLLLHAFRLLDDERPGFFRLKIVGMGEEYGRLRSLENRLGLAGKIEWVGPVSHSAVPMAIAHLDIAVLPYTLSTGAPMKLFEYAALARPVVAPGLHNLRELFSDEEMCFVEPGKPEPLAEAILGLSIEQEAAQAMGLRAQARVKRDYILEQLLRKILDCVCAG